jgi:hypothetical protein
MGAPIEMRDLKFEIVSESQIAVLREAALRSFWLQIIDPQRAGTQF